MFPKKMVEMGPDLGNFREETGKGITKLSGEAQTPTL